jgi:hypothetical protein
MVTMLALGAFASAAALANAQTTTPTTTEATATSSPTATTTSVQSAAATTSPVGTTTSPAAPIVPTTSTPLDTAGQARVINLAANISNQLEASIDRFNTIADRLEARAARIDTGGGDTTIPQQYITQLRAETAAAQSQLSTIDQRVGAMATAANPAAAWQPIKQTYQQTAQQIRAARSRAVASIAALKVANSFVQ